MSTRHERQNNKLNKKEKEKIKALMQKSSDNRWWTIGIEYDVKEDFSDVYIHGFEKNEKLHLGCLAEDFLDRKEMVGYRLETVTKHDINCFPLEKFKGETLEFIYDIFFVICLLYDNGDCDIKKTGYYGWDLDIFFKLRDQ